MYYYIDVIDSLNNRVAIKISEVEYQHLEQVLGFGAHPKFTVTDIEGVIHTFTWRHTAHTHLMKTEQEITNGNQESSG